MKGSSAIRISATSRSAWTGRGATPTAATWRSTGGWWTASATSTRCWPQGRRHQAIGAVQGAETDYFHRLAASGEVRIFYEPRAIVYHQVMPFQVEKKYFRTIHYNAGYQRALYDQTSFPERYSACRAISIRCWLRLTASTCGRS